MTERNFGVGEELTLESVVIPAINKRLAFFALLSFLLVACSNSQSASSANFPAALQAYYDRHPVCISLAFTLPANIDVHGIEPMRPQLRALVEAGLLTAVPVKPAEGNASGATLTAQQIDYRIASGTGKFIHKARDSFMGGTDLCFAQRKITKIVSFTAPAKVMDRTVTEVRYDVELTNIAAWAQKAAIVTVLPAIEAALSKPSSSEAETMILTDRGWQLERDAR